MSRMAKRQAVRGGGKRLAAPATGADAPITPLSIPKDVRTLMVFGGSFDPPHFYHTIGPLSVMARLFGQEAWLLYVPAATSPLKKAGPRVSDAHRLAMLKRALDVPGRRSIWTDELDRAAWLRARGETPRASYTIDTLRRLRATIPRKVTLRLLIGSDQAADFHRWKDAREIIEIAEPVVMVREPIVTACSLWSALGDAWTREEKVAWCRRIAPNFPHDAASTDLRDAIPGAPGRAEHWDRRKRLGGIITSVAQYIIDHNLYGHRPGRSKPASEQNASSREIDGDGSVGRGVMSRLPERFESALTPSVHAPPRRNPKPRRRTRRE